MRNAMLALMFMLIAACQTKTEFGPCIGLLDQKSPALKHDWATWNIVGAAFFSETIIIPLVIAAKYLECPVSEK